MANRDLSLTSDFTGLDMDSLIGGPLMAAAKANNMMAVTQTRFLLDTCFELADGNTAGQGSGQAAGQAAGQTAGQGAASQTVQKMGGEYKPIMVNMSLNVPMIIDGKINPSEVKFQLPLLTIVPLNSLAVETAEVAFEMEVKSAFAEDQNDKKETELKAAATFEAKLGVGPFSCNIKGSVSYDQKDSSTHNTHYEKSNCAKYNVKVTAGQLPLPKGVNTIIDAFAKAIQPTTIPSHN